MQQVNKIFKIKYTFLVIIILFFFSCNFAKAQKFYQADDVSEATIKLYPVDDETQADIRVCIVYDIKDLNGECVWLEVDNPVDADITTIFVDEESQADFKIVLVENKVQAGFATEDKRQHFLELIKQAK